MSHGTATPMVIHGWTVFAHPLFLAQVAALGERHKHWFRAKFFQQYRLLFRYHASSKVIVLAWVNDEETRRAYESSDDAYHFFRKMLENGHPPGDWDHLLAEARAEGECLQRFSASFAP